VRYAAASLLVVLLASALGCNAILGLEPTTLASDGGRGGDGSGAQSPGTCSGWAGPESVNIENIFCIDSTQVTNVQYAQFVHAVTPQMTQQAPGCEWNDTFNPATGLPLPGTMDDYPVGSVDFCDAWAYCAWAGKRMCAEFTRQSMGLDDPTTGEVYHACAGGSRLLPYAYGNVYDPNACPTPAGAAVPVKSRPGCASIVYPNLYDLCDDIGFWENMCSGLACRDTNPIGGIPAAQSHRCDDSNSDSQMFQYPAIGIRCCSDVIPP
jgi:formylglycine-generating enzyme required for sulfatase activity